MLKLKQNMYWEIDIQEIEKLILEYFSVQINIIENKFHNQTYYVINNTSKDLEQILDQETINYCLLSRDAKYDRLEQALWCLIVKDVLPEGNYLVSIFW